MIAVVVMLPILAMSAPPAFRHDWTWPVATQSLSHYLDPLFSPWLPNGLGSPNLSPPAPVPLVSTYVSMWLFGIKGGLNAVFFLLCAVAALGASSASVALLGIGWRSSIVAAALYVGLPAYGDVIIAGHLGLMFTWSALPWLIYGFVRSGRSLVCRWLCIASGAACLSQVQYIVAVPLIVLLAALTLQIKGRAITASLILLAVIFAGSATLVPLIRNADAQSIAVAERTNIQWEKAQSVPLLDALTGTGYEPGYDKVHSHIAALQVASNAALFLLALCTLAVLVLLIARRRRAGVFVGAVYAAGVLIVSCLDGPLAPVFKWAYLNTADASAFRETFHFVPLVVLPVSMCVAIAIEYAFRRRLNVIGFVLLSTAALSVVGAATGQMRQFLKPYSDAELTNQILQKVAALGEDERIAIAPIRQPVRSVVAQTVGVDPLSEYALKDHWVMRSYVAPDVGIAAMAGDLVDQGRITDAVALYRLVSVSGIFLRPTVVPGSTVSSEPSGLIALRKKWTFERPDALRFIRTKALPIVYGSQIPLLTGGDLSILRRPDGAIEHRVLAFMRQHPRFVDLQAPFELAPGAAREDILIAEGCGTIEIPQPSLYDAWPSRAWARSSRFGFQDIALDAPLTNGVVTSVRNPALSTSKPHLLAVIDGSDVAQFRWGTVQPRIGPGQALADSGEFIQTCTGHLTPRLAYGSVRVKRTIRKSDWKVTGAFDLLGSAGTVVFTDAFNDRWSLEVDGRPVDHRSHFAAFGTVNGWDVAGITPGSHSFALIYAPRASFWVISAVALITWAAIFLGLTMAIVLELLFDRRGWRDARSLSCNKLVSSKKSM